MDLENAGWLNGQDAGWGVQRAVAKFVLMDTTRGWKRVLKSDPTKHLDKHGRLES